jgi:ABC-type transport system involved in multi-copper enzyme maturation permease subunit
VSDSTHGGSSAAQSATIRKALLLDAIYQVLDNRVFRILLVTVGLLIFATFAIGFREDEVVLLFGWKSFSYERILEMFPVPLSAGIPEREGLIRFVQTIFLDKLAGNLGITFAIAATSFFVPRLLEKGLADGLFSKPISRLSFYLSCYFTGIVFVGALALLLVVGMHIGLLVSSDYSDPGFLWGALTLTYVFAVVHGVSMLIGVYTRSSVAALLLSLLFFMGNGCVHFIWSSKEFALQQEEIVARLTPEAGTDADKDDGVLEALLHGLTIALDTAHYTLPKTSEAEYITDLLRAKISRETPEFLEPDSGLRIQSLPTGYSLSTDTSKLASADLRMGLVSKRAEFLAQFELEGVGDRARMWIERSPALDSDRSMSETLEKKLKGTPGVGNVRRGSAWQRGRNGRTVQWIQATDGEARRQHMLVASNNSWVVALCLDAAEDWTPAAAELGEAGEAGEEPMTDEAATAARQQVDEAQLDVLNGLFKRAQFDDGTDSVLRNADDPGERWIRRNFGWSAPWKYNAWFSLGSSIAFGVLILALGAWRLRRIDF